MRMAVHRSSQLRHVFPPHTMYRVVVKEVLRIKKKMCQSVHFLLYCMQISFKRHIDLFELKSEILSPTCKSWGERGGVKTCTQVSRVETINLCLVYDALDSHFIQFNLIFKI